MAALRLCSRIHSGPRYRVLNLTKAVNGCMLDNLGAWGVADPSKLAADKAKSRAAKGEIDPISDVTGDKVYLFPARPTAQSSQRSSKRPQDFMRLGVPAANVKFVSQMPAGHAFVTESEGAACEKTGEPYVVDCDYDQAGELLKHIYGPLTPGNAAPAGTFMSSISAPFIKRSDAEWHG